MALSPTGCYARRKERVRRTFTLKFVIFWTMIYNDRRLLDLTGMRYFCVHGHFYQPPREDPLRGVIPIESGAKPYPNWNERIHAECYRPNAVMGNFEHISFNLGPTLCAWLSDQHPDTLAKIVSQDRANVERFGVGNALAQPYNHTILPLASYRDKVTQVVWGMVDFEHRFGRKPQGMWLPETAVNQETLNILADHGIQFTILAPWQAEGKDVDVTHPYRISLDGNRRMAAFFYHGDLSSGVSFNPNLTTNADHFVLHQLSPRYKRHQGRDEHPQILLLASDGELYGHHQPLRDYFLAHLVNGASENVGLAPTYPGLWLQRHPPEATIHIRENTSWSCHHGVARWQTGCSCTPGDGNWKTSLRTALDRLAVALDGLYVRELTPYLSDPWVLRNGYIYVMLGMRQVDDLIAEAAGRRLPVEANTKIELLLKAQLERQRMYTSCGWFFEDFDRIEPRNNLTYAAQASRLAYLATGVDLCAGLRRDLQGLVSPVTGLTGEQVLGNCTR
jgi:hypothetical protein